jgi:hypothetical protein
MPQMALPTVRQVGVEQPGVERIEPAEAAVMSLGMNKKAQTQEIRNLGWLR